MTVNARKTDNSNPLLRSNFLNRIFYWWLRDIIWYGKKHDFYAQDLYDVIPKDLSEPLSCRLESNWIEEMADARKSNKKPSLWKVVMRTYGWNFMKLSVLPMCFISLQTVYPQLLKLIILYFQSTSEISTPRAYFNATLLIFFIILRTLFAAHGRYHLSRLGMRARIACTSLIYRKLLKLSSSAQQNFDSSVISLLSMDVSKFEDFFMYAPYLFIAPVYLLVGTYLISQYVGISAACIGVALLILQSYPIQAAYTKLTLRYRAMQASRTDYRISLINEIFNGIRAVKMYVWENLFEKLVFTARNLEIQSYLKISYLTAVIVTITSVSHRLSTIAITLTYVLQRGTMTADKILPVTQHLYHMKTGTTYYFFQGLRRMTDMCVSMRRIEEFLLLEEVSFDVEDKRDSVDELVSIENVTAYWDKKSVIFQEISLDFTAKKLYAVLGSVGSGKSSLLQLILGELPAASGKVRVHGRVSYSSQEPWLFNGFIRENILFGQDYDAERYEKAVNACALAEDFRHLPYGDETLVGERGSSLSGGQRARVNLARAVYREADIYLLDYPLSAVDSLVGQHIMKECVNGFLRDKTRILTMHGIQDLNEVSEIILLDHGKVEFRGSMLDFRRNNQSIARLINDKLDLSKENDSQSLSISEPISTNDFSSMNKKAPKETEELIAKGAMKSSVYLNYIKAGGWNMLFLVIVMNALFVITVAIFDFGLATWNNNKNTLSKNVTRPIEYISNVQSSYGDTNILIFVALMIIIMFISILKSVLLCKLALNASKEIHNNILSRLMRASLRFFEANSTGKILNRFSEDTNVMDNALTQTLTVTINPIFNTIATLASTIIANWWIVFPGSILVFITSVVGKIYVRIIQKIKRLSANANSPILSFAASSLEGMVTIRACKAEHIVIKHFNNFQDLRTAATFLTVVLPEAFSLWVDLINVGFLALLAYFFVFMKNNETHGSYVGLILMQVISITGTVSRRITKVAEVLAHMTSVERMLQFKKLEQESLTEDEPILKVPTDWPNKGQIIFEHLYLRYSDDSKPVLWDLSCRIESGSKIGIVGRTGAGKSSIISALFRFAKFDGSLLIDGLDIKGIPLYELRSKLSVIPQEPVLFKTSLRKNLDPLGKFDDSTLYSALESVELQCMFDSLDSPIERGGSNMSVGQRQLLCLARAIVIRNKILILDEATANIDSSTDALIQKTIRSEFKDCTVLTIAHRLNTVMDSDKILVMDDGRLVEFDHPFSLMQNKDSHLLKMVQQCDEATIKKLMAVAEQAYIAIRATKVI